MKQKAILTFDLEFWYNDLTLEKYLPAKENFLPDYTEESVGQILDLLKKYKVKATFFILGKLAERYPKLIKNIFNEGHELASHGYSHKCLWNLNKESFERELRATSQTIKDITGFSVKGFRAPNFSLNKKTDWVFDVLKQNDFQYDSSIFPVKTPLYGNNNALLNISRINNSLIEFPPAVYKLSRIKIPVGGGSYFRFIPIKLYIYFIKKIAAKGTPVLYFHPHDLYCLAPRVKGIPWFFLKIKFYGAKNNFKKLEILLKNFDFISIENYLLSNQL